MARCLVSTSSPVCSPAFAPLQLIRPPSSPFGQDQDALPSPSSSSFNHSFASSMSLTANPICTEPTPLNDGPPTPPLATPVLVVSSSPSFEGMDYSPAPPLPSTRQFHSDNQVPTLRAPPALDRAHSDSAVSAGPQYPFLAKLLREKAEAAKAPEVFALPEAPPRASSSRSRAPIPSAWSATRHTAPPGTAVLQLPSQAPVKRLSEPSLPTLHASHAPSSSPFRMDIDGASPPPQHPHSANTLTGLFPSRPPNHPRSVSDVCDHRRCSSPTGSDASGASDRLFDYFNSDMSPIATKASRGVRKRVLDMSHSPTPGPSGSEGTFGGLTADDQTSSPPRPQPPMLARRPFEKASSTNNLRQARRRVSSNALSSLNKRPALSAVLSMGPPPTGADQKRHAEALHGKPATTKSVRRAYSVADAALQPLSANVAGPRPASVTMGKEMGASMLSKERGSYFPSLGRTQSQSIDIGMMDVTSGVQASPADHGSPLAGYRNAEEKGKALPCFPVKDDGLMRISAATLNMLQGGSFAEEVASYTIIDCRFKYEYEAGHIQNAVNISDTRDIVPTFMETDDLPEPSTSEKHVPGGKHILIFHCEFSAKRAPTSATLLRKHDRNHNSQHYPKVCYPEIYILAGGFAEYYDKYRTRCDGNYLSMDHPDHTSKRTVDLHAFRQNARPFARAASFTFGEAQSASAMLRVTAAGAPLAAITKGSDAGGSKKSSSKSSSSRLAPANFIFPQPSDVAQSSSVTITEEEHESGDSSFCSTNPGSSPCGPSGAAGGESPCPANSKLGRHSLKLVGMGGVAEGGRRPFMRAQTTGAAMFGFARRQ